MDDVEPCPASPDGRHCACWYEGNDECCGCYLLPDDGDPPWADDVIVRPIETVELPGVSR